MVSYEYPPYGAMGGIRTSKFAKFLPSYGWHPTILTVSKDKTRWGYRDASEGILPDVKVIRAPLPDIRGFIRGRLFGVGLSPSAANPRNTMRQSITGYNAFDSRGHLLALFMWLRRMAAIPDTCNLWFPPSFLRGMFEMSTKPYKAIYSTSPPQTDHLVAASLSAIMGIPWIADYRDPWSQNVAHHENKSSNMMRFERGVERRVLSRVSTIITVSEMLAEDLRKLHGEKPYGIHFISSGFDIDDYPKDIPLISNRFVITYTGMLYGLRRDPTMLFQAIEELIDERYINPEDIRVRFYGPDKSDLERIKKSLSYPQIVEIHGVIPRSESIIKQSESTAILIIQWDNPYTSKFYGGKIFEHLGVRRPIIAITNCGSALSRLISQTNIGYASSDKAQLKMTLLKLLDEYKQIGTLKYSGIEKEVDKYRWNILANELAGILDRISK